MVQIQRILGCIYFSPKVSEVLLSRNRGHDRPINTAIGPGAVGFVHTPDIGFHLRQRPPKRIICWRPGHSGDCGLWRRIKSRHISHVSYRSGRRDLRRDGIRVPDLRVHNRSAQLRNGTFPSHKGVFSVAGICTAVVCRSSEGTQLGLEDTPSIGILGTPKRGDNIVQLHHWLTQRSFSSEYWLTIWSILTHWWYIWCIICCARRKAATPLSET